MHARGDHGARASGRTVLVVDDDPAIRGLLADLLADAGYAVLQAPNGAEALRLAGERPGAILLDLALPGLSGADVLRRLKADPATRDVPVIVASAYPWALSPDQARRAAEVVWKPFDLPRLLASVAHATAN
jgi:CheY-like chemotaxis protein